TALDTEDPFIRRLVARKMRLLAEGREADRAPDDAALEAYLDLHADRYREPERTSLWHVFVSSARGTAGERDARALLARLRADATPTTGRLGDPFPFGAYVRAESPRELAKHFGETFAAGVARPPVRAWAGPGALLRPALPPDCRVTGTPTEVQDVESVTTRWSARCDDGGLVGRTIGVDGLVAGKNDALLRVTLADGRVVKSVLRAATPRLTI